MERVHGLRATETAKGDSADGEGSGFKEDQKEEEMMVGIIKLFMGKKIRYQYLTGALLKPYFRFINKVELGINPISDPRGTRIA